MSFFKGKTSGQCPANCVAVECPLIVELRDLIAQGKLLSAQFDSYGESLWQSTNLPQYAVDLLSRMRDVSVREMEIEQILGISKY